VKEPPEMENDPLVDSTEMRDTPLTTTKENSHPVNVMASGVERTNAETPSENVFVAAELNVVSVKLNVPADTLIRQNPISSPPVFLFHPSSVSVAETRVKAHLLSDSSDPEESRRDVTPLPKVNPNENSMSAKDKLPSFDIPAPPSPRWSVNETVALVSATFDFTTVPLKTNFVDNSAVPLRVRVAEPSFFKWEAPTVTLPQGHSSIPQ
jgi:hypothetical protein